MSASARPPVWTVQDARTARLQAETAQRGVARMLSPVGARAVHAKNRLKAAIIGSRAYDAQLAKVAQHMNRNHDAFDHYTPRLGDVVVAAYFKAGTNWIMHVCHQICHLGLAEFDHIQDVIPWPDAAEPKFWVNVHDDTVRQTPTGLRVIKSHLPASKVALNTQAKYIAVTRDPKDCAASAYHFFKALVFGATMPPPNVWLAHFKSQQPNFGPWDVFTATWFEVRYAPNVMFLCFEDIKRDPAQAITDIAAFLGVALTQAQHDRVLEATSIDAMRAINHKFYPARQSRFTDPSGKIIRKGKVGDARTLFDPQDLAQFDTHWRQALAARGSAFPYDQRYGADQAGASAL